MPTGSAQFSNAAQAMEQAVLTGDFRGALDLFHSGLDPAVRAEPKVELLAATAAARLGDWQQAATLGVSVLERCRKAPDPVVRLLALNLLGGLAFERGSISEAEGQLREALELSREIGDREVAPKILTNLASVTHIQGRVSDAIALYEEAVGLYKEAGYERGLAETYHNIAILHRQERAWSGAHVAQRKAIQHAANAKEHSLQALTHMGAAELYLEIGDPASVDMYLQAADNFLAQTEDHAGDAELERLRARLALAKGNASAARRHAATGQALATTSGLPVLENECAGVAAVAAKRLGAGDAQREHDEVAEALQALGAVSSLAEFERQWAGVR